MKKGIPLDLGAATTEVVDIVAFQGDQIARSSEVNAPVGVTVACGGVACNTVEVVVRDRYTLRCVSSQDKVLTANAGGLS